MDLATLTALPDLLPLLNKSERDLLDQLLTPRPVWTPLPGPQLQAYLSQADELFYGGSAGGGKSDLLLGLALCHRRAIIFRREYAQLRAIIERGQELFAGRARFNGSANLWRFQDGRTLELGAVQHEPDVRRYQGRPHSAKLFDELPQFTESQYRFLIAWARTTTPGERVRIVGAGNPPTVAEGEWVIRYWGPWLDSQHMNPARPGELRWFATVDGETVERENGQPFDWHDETIQPRSRTFLPARLTDNPYLMATDYGAVLQAMPEPLRSQMLYGDFTVGHTDDPWQVIPTEWVRAAQSRWTTARPPGPQTAVGVDVARGGRDQTVLARRIGVWYAPLERHAGAETPDGQTVTAMVGQALMAGGVASIDVIGVGASVYDLCRQQGLLCAPINFADAAPAMDRTGTLRLTNMRAFVYWSLRESLDPVTGDGLMLPPDRELLVDLCTPRWSMRPSGIVIESKDDIVQRLHRSPDSGDAVALAFAVDRARALTVLAQGRARGW